MRFRFSGGWRGNASFAELSKMYSADTIMNPQVLGIMCALASASAWAIGAIMYKKIGEEVSASGMALAKTALSLPFLFAALAITGTGDVSLTYFALLSLSGVLGIACGDTLFFKSLQLLGAHALVVLALLSQVLTVFLAIMFLGEMPTFTMWIGIILIVLGVGTVLHSKISDDDSKKSNLAGIWYGLLSVVCMSVAVIMTKKCMESVTATMAVSIRMFWGVVGLTAWGLLTNNLKSSIEPFRDTRLIKNIFFAVLIATFGGFWLFHVSLKYIDVSIANTLNSTEVIFLIPLGAIFLKEKVTRMAIFGTLISMGGIMFLFK